MIKVALEAKIKESEEEIKRKDEEIKVALKKQVRLLFFVVWVGDFFEDLVNKRLFYC